MRTWTTAHTSPYLRPDIPIYCSEESKLIMQNFDETGSDQYLTLKEKFRIHEGKGGEIMRTTGDKVKVPRRIETFESGKEFSIDSIDGKSTTRRPFNSWSSCFYFAY